MRCTIEAAVAYLGGMDGVGCLESAANQMWARTRQVWRRSPEGTARTIEAAVAYLGGMDGVGCWGVLQTK